MVTVTIKGVGMIWSAKDTDWHGYKIKTDKHGCFVPKIWAYLYLDKNIIFTLFILVFVLNIFIVNSSAQMDLGTIVVTGTRFHSTLASQTQRVTIIDREEIESLPAKSVPELLSYVSGVDVVDKSGFGIQGDIGIRGATFQETQILIDGIRVNDSQTAHHNMDLPISFEDIERIEILHGGGSSVYGPDGMGGVVNIITKREQRDRLESHFLFGGNRTKGLGLRYSKAFGNLIQAVSLEKRDSDGFRYDTDYDQMVLSSHSHWIIPSGDIRLLLGYMDKEFGAFDFYTPGSNLPSREWTETKFFASSANLSIGKYIFSPKVFFRRHNDDFVLDKGDPDFYRNKHIKESIGTEISGEIPLKEWGRIILGGELAGESIDSSNLGVHNRLRHALFSEYRYEIFNRVNLDVGGRYDYSDWGNVYSPRIGGAFYPFSKWKVYTNYSKTFRQPSFTELYYESPVNIGDEDLIPERDNSYEVGLAFLSGRYFTIQCSVFQRQAKNLIDWGKEREDDNKWQVMNIGKARFNGIDINGLVESGDWSCRLGYSQIDSNTEEEYISKYGFKHLLHKGVLNLGGPFLFGIRQNWQGVYREREGEEGCLLFSTRLSHRIDNFHLQLDFKNIFNEQDPDSPQDYIHPRWLGFTVGWII